MANKFPMTASVSELTGAFKRSTIQRSWSFVVDFLDQDFAELIPPYRIIGVSLPFLTLNSDSTFKAAVPVSFPAGAEADPIEFTFTVVEDSQGTARTLAQHLASRVRRPNGMYVAPSAAKFSGMSIKILDYSGNVMDMYHVKDVLYQSVEPISFDHEGSELVKMQFTCKADIVSRIVPQE